MPSRKTSKGAYPKSSTQHNLNVTPRNCNACNEPDSIDDQVECEKCLAWYHFQCAGVNESVKNHSFVCAECNSQVPVGSSSCHSGKSNTSSARALRMQIELQRMEEEKLLREKLLRERTEEERSMQEKENALHEKILRQEKERRAKEMQERQSIEAEHIAKRFDIMLSLVEEKHGSEGSKSCVTSRSGVSKVKQWLNTQPATTSETISGSKITPIVIPSADEEITKHVSQMQQLDMFISPQKKAIVNEEVPNFDISSYAPANAMVQPQVQPQPHIPDFLKPGFIHAGLTANVLSSEQAKLCKTALQVESHQHSSKLFDQQRSQRDDQSCSQPPRGDPVTTKEDCQPRISTAWRPPLPTYNKHQQSIHEVMPVMQTVIKPVESAQSSGVFSLHSENGKSTLFRLIPVTIYGQHVHVDTFAFMDDGSELTLMDERLADQLDIKGQVSPLSMQWTSDITRTESDSRIMQIKISGRKSNRQYQLKDVRTVTNLNLPSQTLSFSELQKRFNHLRGLPMESYSNVTPQLLIGLNNTHLSTALKFREGTSGEPVATKSRLGWSVHGNLSGIQRVQRDHHHVQVCRQSSSITSNEKLHEMVQNFFNVESVGVSVVPLLESADDERARSILKNTTVRTSSGRYETGLLWRYDFIEFPESWQMAERRLQCLERRLSANPELYENVRKQITEYEIKGYAHKATEEELRTADLRRVWYLPLGVVMNTKKPDKVRIVWDAAAKVDNVSFNSMMLKGPDLLSSLIGVIFRYRQRQIAVNGDIKEMFHQIRILENDCQSQRFLWRSDRSLPIDIYIMNVATFGSTCSPCSSQYVKNLNAQEYEKQYPRASYAIQRNHYVDDYLDSFDSISEAIEVAKEVKLVHAKAGFEMRKWLSNSTEVTEKVGGIVTEFCKSFTSNESERVLGLVWYPEEDVFRFSLLIREDLVTIIEGNVIPTKREALRLVMSLFDPLGLITMITVHGKVIIQDIWRSGIGWDEKLSSELFCRWKCWTKVLTNLEEIKIPRCYFPHYDQHSYNTLELHTFVDASESAYACVAYFRIVQNGVVRCALVSSRSKVAPLRSTSIPRLELQAAVIGVRLARSIAKEHTINITRRIFWTDSSTVLSWIHSDHRRYKQYVAFRISEILSESSVTEWKWVPTRKNVADEATKWNKNNFYSPSSRWFTAPEFLYEAEENWPRQHPLQTQTTEEIKVIHHHRESTGNCMITFERFSKYERLVRSVAYIHRFVEISRKVTSSENKPNGLTRENLREAETTIWKLVQQESYAVEIEILKKCVNDQQKHIRLGKKSPLYKLSPFIDDCGVVRMDSRLNNALCVPSETRNPIILPKNHYVTNLLVHSYHRRLGHSCNETAVNELRQKFRIPSLRTVVRKVAKNCAWCRIYKTQPAIPRMAPLPLIRLSPYIRPFTFVGLDYCGPFLIRVGRSTVKRYVALFTCMTIRAVHLEVAHALSTESCKLAIRRFIARRGSPQEIYSDQGTNFQGARGELLVELRNINRELAGTFTNSLTQWHFNPPAAPHMGGIWERMVRSVKTALSALAAPRRPDDESFLTVLTEAESIESLTPNHFLLLSSTGVVQTTKLPTEERTTLRNNWNYVQYVLDQFWKRWINEYLPTIADRNKWFEEVTPIKVGDLVVVVDEAIRNSWIRGRVARVYPGKDGRVRRADIKTKSGILQRPVTKIVVLDVSTSGMAEPQNSSSDQQYGVGDVTDDHHRDGNPAVDLPQG
ncbi:uncharacterized protein LOC129773676 [Toxorhynchites rutilus septentrionalis]|uniref:uncharacterized protein LOC129773676 n=1 Tax=Toxorhynchites rutilus septentrionalis TaxID=329112 RepID=UPI00247A46FD|nr:uncharacterized protein LOC129773676 [Toxorhynchites rutilus septentrionalis]